MGIEVAEIKQRVTHKVITSFPVNECLPMAYFFPFLKCSWPHTIILAAHSILILKTETFLQMLFSISSSAIFCLPEVSVALLLKGGVVGADQMNWLSSC